MSRSFQGIHKCKTYPNEREMRNVELCRSRLEVGGYSDSEVLVGWFRLIVRVELRVVTTLVEERAKGIRRSWTGARTT